MFHVALRAGLPPPELRTRSSRELFCLASACACGGAAAADRRADVRQQGHPATKGQAKRWPLFAWEAGVTADVAPDVLRAAPFVYVCARLYNLTGETNGFLVEERLAGKCHCKARASMHTWRVCDQRSRCSRTFSRGARTPCTAAVRLASARVS